MFSFCFSFSYINTTPDSTFASELIGRKLNPGTTLSLDSPGRFAQLPRDLKSPVGKAFRVLLLTPTHLQSPCAWPWAVPHKFGKSGKRHASRDRLYLCDQSVRSFGDLSLPLFLGDPSLCPLSLLGEHFLQLVLQRNLHNPFPLKNVTNHRKCGNRICIKAHSMLRQEGN